MTRPLFSAEAEFVTTIASGGGVERAVCLTVLASSDPGPVREFRPVIDFDLDEAHATELLGKLTIALDRLRRDRAFRERQPFGVFP